MVVTVRKLIVLCTTMGMQDLNREAIMVEAQSNTDTAGQPNDLGTGTALPPAPWGKPSAPARSLRGRRHDDARHWVSLGTYANYSGDNWRAAGRRTDKQAAPWARACHSAKLAAMKTYGSGERLSRLVPPDATGGSSRPLRDPPRIFISCPRRHATSPRIIPHRRERAAGGTHLRP
ncbi:hypothetical protein MRX96_030926 [Rhipicephalus microplus]